MAHGITPKVAGDSGEPIISLVLPTPKLISLKYYRVRYDRELFQLTYFGVPEAKYAPVISVNHSMNYISQGVTA